MSAQQQTDRRAKRAVTVTAFSAILIALGSVMVACSSGSGGKSLPAPPPQTAPAPATPAQGAPAKPLDDNSSTDSNHKITKPAPSGGSGQQPPPTGSPTPTAPAPNEVIMDPTGLTPDQIFASSDAQGPSPIGARASVVNGEPLFYSGAAQDFLHEQVREQSDNENDAAKLARNKKFAQEIGLSTFEVNWATREAKLSVTMTVGGRSKNLNYVGTLDNELKITGNDAAEGIRYEAVCMDAQGGCHTTHVRLKKGLAIANIIVRLSNAYMYVDGNPPGASNNPEYDNLMNLLLNSVNDRGGPDTVQALGFYTSETIYGSSNFAILMRLGIQDPNRAAGDAQVMGLMGPLVKHSQMTDESVHINTPPSEATVIGGRTFMLPTVITNTIREVRLVRNDGRGNLQFNITIRKPNAQANEDTIRLTFARLQTDVRALVLP